MNKRIEKLVAEAFFDETADASDNKMYKLNDTQMQKFAELIVTECVRVCVADLADPRDSVELRCAKKIQKHFEAES